MKKNVWVVTFHFNRGHVMVSTFDHKLEAAEAVRIAVFNNEDCVNCSIYKQEVEAADDDVVNNRMRFNLQKG